MTRRMIFPLLLGLVGAVVLIALGLWQEQRLAWKEDVLARIESRIAAAPVALPAAPDPARDEYLPVTITGHWGSGALRVLASVRRVGAGHRMIRVLETADGGRVLVDRGFLPDGAAPGPLPEEEVTVTGNLHWPDEVDGFTPEPDLESGLWFARDVPAMAAALDTRPVLVVARGVAPGDPALMRLPVSTAGIPNDHLEYAITWFSLAAVWLGMTGLLVWRIRRKTD